MNYEGVDLHKTDSFNLILLFIGPPMSNVKHLEIKMSILSLIKGSSSYAIRFLLLAFLVNILS